VCEKSPMKRSRYMERRVYVKTDLQKRKETYKRDVMTMMKHTLNNMSHNNDSRAASNLGKVDLFL